MQASSVCDFSHFCMYNLNTEKGQINVFGQTEIHQIYCFERYRGVFLCGCGSYNVLATQHPTKIKRHSPKNVSGLSPGGGCPSPKPLWAVVHCQESVSCSRLGCWS